MRHPWAAAAPWNGSASDLFPSLAPHDPSEAPGHARGKASAAPRVRRESSRRARSVRFWRWAMSARVCSALARRAKRSSTSSGGQATVACAKARALSSRPAAPCASCANSLLLERISARPWGPRVPSQGHPTDPRHPRCRCTAANYALRRQVPPTHPPEGTRVGAVVPVRASQITSLNVLSGQLFPSAASAPNRASASATAVCAIWSLTSARLGQEDIRHGPARPPRACHWRWKRVPPLHLAAHAVREPSEADRAGLSRMETRRYVPLSGRPQVRRAT